MIEYDTIGAVELLNKGKRLTHRMWGNGHYIYKAQDGSIMSSKTGMYEIDIGVFQKYNVSSWYEYTDIDAAKDGLESKPVQIEKSGPCCKCGCPDEYNSKGIDGQWYCYKHCSW